MILLEESAFSRRSREAGSVEGLPACARGAVRGVIVCVLIGRPPRQEASGLGGLLCFKPHRWRGVSGPRGGGGTKGLDCRPSTASGRLIADFWCASRHNPRTAGRVLSPEALCLSTATGARP